jgi:hypothetical protein
MGDCVGFLLITLITTLPSGPMPSSQTITFAAANGTASITASASGTTSLFETAAVVTQGQDRIHSTRVGNAMEFTQRCLAQDRARLLLLIGRGAMHDHE